MIVVVTGSRHYTDRDVINKVLDRVVGTDNCYLLHGDCSGADTIANEWAVGKENVKVVKYPANWSEHGKAAGPIRNTSMMKGAKQLSENFNLPVKVLAFHFEGQYIKSGTENAVRAACQVFTGHSNTVSIDIHLKMK